LDIDNLYKEMKNDEKVIIDVKGILDRECYEKKGYIYWRL